MGGTVAVHVGGVPAGLARVDAEQLRLLRAEPRLTDTLEQLAIQCAARPWAHLASLGARTAEIARPASPSGYGARRCNISLLAASPLSVTSQRIHDLVETASAFGSAGMFVTALVALFTRVGGTASACASVAAGMVVWAAGKYAPGCLRPCSHCRRR